MVSEDGYTALLQGETSHQCCSIRKYLRPYRLAMFLTVLPPFHLLLSVFLQPGVYETVLPPTRGKETTHPLSGDEGATALLLNPTILGGWGCPAVDRGHLYHPPTVRG